MKTLTVVIPTHNNITDLRECLDALANQTNQDFDILVVDGHSIDGTDVLAKAYNATVIYEEVGTRAGAMNTALKAIKTKYWASTDADCIPEPEWVARIISTLKFTQKDVAGIGGPNWSPNSDTLFAKAVDVLFFSPFMTGGARYSVNEPGLLVVDHNPGCNAGYKTKYTKKLIYDESLPTAEDVVFDYNLRQQGLKILFTPWIFMKHKRRNTLKGFFMQLYKYGLGRAIANKKYPIGNIFHALPIFFVGFILLGLMLSPWCPTIRMLFITCLLGYFSFAAICVALSKSFHKTISTVIIAIGLSPIAYFAWGLGYFAGLNEFSDDYSGDLNEIWHY